MQTPSREKFTKRAERKRSREYINTRKNGEEEGDVEKRLGRSFHRNEVFLPFAEAFKRRHQLLLSALKKRLVSFAILSKTGDPTYSTKLEINPVKLIR